jgi:hypothetical protein
MRAALVADSDGTFNEQVIYESPSGGTHIKYNEEVSHESR